MPNSNAVTKSGQQQRAPKKKEATRKASPSSASKKKEATRKASPSSASKKQEENGKMSRSTKAYAAALAASTGLNIGLIIYALSKEGMFSGNNSSHAKNVSGKSGAYTSLVPLKMCIKKKFKTAKDMAHELQFLNLLSGLKHFATVQHVDKKHKTITLSYNGERIHSKNCPADYKAQLKVILRTLQKYRIYHNDIWGPNFVVDKNKVITLIDFGRATFNQPVMDYRNITMKEINKSTSFSDFLINTRLASFWSGNYLLY